jgi:hypothetical protein
MQIVSTTMARLLNAKGVIVAKEFFNGECNKIAVTSFSKPKMAALLLLGFSSGLPLFLTSRTLQIWMTEENVDLGVIGLFAVVALPYSLKFLWSPLLDRFVPPFMGRRRGWLVITQVGLLVAIAAMAFQKPAQDVQVLQLLALNALIITFLSATQDIAGDAYRTDVLKPNELETGASVWVLGYRIALLATSFLALVLADYLPWNVVYLIMAALHGSRDYHILLDSRSSRRKFAKSRALIFKRCTFSTLNSFVSSRFTRWCFNRLHPFKCVLLGSGRCDRSMANHISFTAKKDIS